MTFIKKLLQDRPDLEFAKSGTIGCPSDYGYESKRDYETTSNGRRCRGTSCPDCWARQMPETGEQPHILDSGERRQFETGAVRDIQEGKGRCDLMPLRVVGLTMRNEMLTELGMFLDTGDTKHLYHCLGYFCKNWDDGKTKPDRDAIFNQRAATMFLEVAKHFEEGAKKYGENNWQKGLPAKCYIDSAVRHYLKWLRGDKDEPHDRAFVWNLLCCIWEVDFSPRAKERENVPDVKSYTCKLIPVTGDADLVRLGDYAGGIFEFADTAYAKVKLEYELENNVLCIDVLTGGVHVYNPDILVKPLAVWKVDGDEDE